MTTPAPIPESFRWPDAFRDGAPELVARLEREITESGLRELAGVLRENHHESALLLEAATRRTLDFHPLEPGVHYATAVATILSSYRIKGYLAWVALETYELWCDLPWAANLRRDLLDWFVKMHIAIRGYIIRRVDGPFLPPTSAFMRPPSGLELFRTPPFSARSWNDLSSLAGFPVSFYNEVCPVVIPLNCDGAQ